MKEAKATQSCDCLSVAFGPQSGRERKYVVLRQWGGQPIEKVVQNAGHLESLPFDGVNFTVPASWDLMLAGVSWSYDNLLKSILPIKAAFSRLDQIFVVVHTRGFPDVFDDWSQVTENFRHLARAAKEVGITGIMYDNETYKEKGWHYPREVRYPERSRGEYQDHMRLRGQQIMEAVCAEFPDITFVVYFGPYVSEPKTPEGVILRQSGRDYNDLRGSFFVGIVEGSSAQATVVDGGKLYQYRSEQHFERSYQWRKFGIASVVTDCPFIPAHVRTQWAEKISVAFMCYEKQWLDGYPMDPAIMRPVLECAIRRTDRYVFFYAESEWVAPGDVTREWLEAVTEGIRQGKQSGLHPWAWTEWGAM